MIYTDYCCYCIELRCGCILIAIIDVILRGLDRFVVDRKYRMSFCNPTDSLRSPFQVLRHWE